MPINVFGNSSNNSDNKFETSIFVKKSHLKSNFIEDDIEEDINLKGRYRIKNLPNPINNTDGVNKIDIDNKIADIIKRNTQNDDFLCFIDNNNNEYKLKRYREEKFLTDETLFQLLNLGNETNTKWSFEILDQHGSDLLSNLIVPRSANMYSGALINKQDDTRAFLFVFSGRTISDDAYVKLERRNIHNVRRVKLVYSRPNIDNVSGRFTISLLHNNNTWVEALKFDNDQYLTDDYVWGVEEVDVNFNNYGIMLKYNNVKTNKQGMAISRILITYAV